MKIVCAWCNGKIGGTGSLLSHGICNKCFGQFMQSQFDFMRTLPSTPRTSNRNRTSRQRIAKTRSHTQAQ